MVENWQCSVSTISCTVSTRSALTLVREGGKREGDPLQCIQVDRFISVT